jgi:hypothetical protein
MIDPLSAVYLLVIGLCLPAVAYLLPQDRAVVRLVARLRRGHIQDAARRSRGLD